MENKIDRVYLVLDKALFENGDIVNTRSVMLEQVIEFVKAFGSIQVHATTMLPYESLDPEKPGMIHAVMWSGELLVSKECFQALKEYTHQTNSSSTR